MSSRTSGSGGGHLEKLDVRVRPSKVRYSKSRYWVKAHFSHTKSGKRIEIKGHWVDRNRKTTKRKGYSYDRTYVKFNGGFNKLVQKVVDENKGKINPRTGKKYTKAELVQYGKDVAADVYRRKLAKYNGR